jgi:uncharacterized membrane protein YphA (DoxX/SURF4 family)
VRQNQDRISQLAIERTSNVTTLNIPLSNRDLAHRRPSAAPYVLWTMQVALGLLFLFAGATKFTMSAHELTKDINLSAPFLRFIGVCEVLGAIGLILPGVTHIRRGLTPLAAGGLVIIMIGAVNVTIPSMGMLAALWPLAVGVVAAFVAYNRTAWLTAG